MLGKQNLVNGDIDNITKIVVIFVLIIQIIRFFLEDLLAIETNLQIHTSVWQSCTNVMDFCYTNLCINSSINYSINIYEPGTVPDTENTVVHRTGNHPCLHWADILQIYLEEPDFQDIDHCTPSWLYVKC